MQRRSFRQWGQLMVGAFLAALAVGIAWAMLGGWIARPATGVAWCVGLLALAYAVFVRPCVVVDQAGVQVRNIVRDTLVPWGALAGAGSSWSLVVDTPTGRWSSWAISGTASPGRDALRRRRRPSGAAAGPFGTAGIELQTGMAGGSAYVATVDAEGVQAGLTPPAFGASAAAIAAFITRLARERANGPGRGPAPVPADRAGESARVRIVWPSVALLVLAALAVPLAALV